MARKYEPKEHDEGYGEDFKHDYKPEKDEGCNAFYTRKQRGPKENEVRPDTDTDYAPEDRDAEYANYKSDRDAGPMNYKKWDRYGR